jgi:hypothetical protein
MLVGGEDNERSYNDYLNPGKTEGPFFNKDTYDTRRIVLTEMKEIVLGDINVRLLSSQTVDRRVAIRNIDVMILQYSLFIGHARRPF